jgi:acyl-CoA reductase-like NAD-dependent aldehyde dehydrogenase
MRATKVWHALSVKERLSYLHTVHTAYLEELKDLASVMYQTTSSEE